MMGFVVAIFLFVAVLDMVLRRLSITCLMFELKYYILYLSSFLFHTFSVHYNLFL